MKSRTIFNSLKKSKLSCTEANSVMKKLFSLAALAFLLLGLSACSGLKDVSEDDLKSPCVSAGSHRSQDHQRLDPCERRSPQHNSYFI